MSIRYESKFEFRDRILSLNRVWCSNVKTRKTIQARIDRLKLLRTKVHRRLAKINENKYKMFMSKYGTLSFYKELHQYNLYHINKIKNGES